MIRRRSTEGFTLIELLVVIAIIGILSGILLPALWGVKERVRRADAKVTIQALTQAVLAYKLREGLYPPSSGGATQETALVIYLDGVRDRSNGNPGPRTTYYGFKINDLAGHRFKDPWGGVYHYWNLAEDPVVQQGATQRETGDPRTTRWNIHSFQIWTEAGSDDVQDWITNYR